MKRYISFFIALLTILISISSVFSASANFNSEKDVVSKLKSYAYYMISLDDESEIFSKNEDKKLAPAAFNKLIAAVVAIEEWKDLDEKIKITKESLSVFPTGYGIRNAALKEGETYTKRKLIDCLIVYSANDAESVIVFNIAGTKEAYLTKVKQLLSKIGCKDTNVVDLLGFDAEGQYTTAKDVSTFLKYALKYPAFSEAFSKQTVTMPATQKNAERTYQSGNKMMNYAISDYYHSSVTGGKYTSTEEAGECIAVTTSKDGYSYLAVVMKGKLENIDSDSSFENTCMTDAKAMINWVYKNIFFKVVASPGQIVYSTQIQAGKGTDTLSLTAEKEVSVLAPSKVSSYSVLVEPVAGTLPEKIKAPVKKGDIICQANIIYANETLATINLVASEDIGLSFAGLIISTVSSVLMSKIFIAFEIIVIVLLLGFLLIRVYNTLKKKEKRIKVVPSDSPQKRSAQPARSTKQSSTRPAQSQRRPAQPPKGNDTSSNYKKYNQNTQSNYIKR